MKKQTAVEWLVEQFDLTSNSLIIKNVIEQAKAMEKEQMSKFLIWLESNGFNLDFEWDEIDFEQYYNETYGKDERD